MTAERIDGDWSEPIYLNSSGFDPSLFHDDDSRKYLLNMLWDHRPGQNRFAGIVLQEYSPREGKLIGQRRLIFRGTPIGFTEGPHLYRRGGYYHLLVAEGGTSWGHAVTMARSRQIEGPYEVHPDTYVLTARSARLRIAVRRPRFVGGNSRRRNVYGLSLRQAAGQSWPLYFGSGNGDRENGLVAGRLASHCRWPGRAAHRGCRPESSGPSFPRAAGAR